MSSTHGGERLSDSGQIAGRNGSDRLPLYLSFVVGVLAFTVYLLTLSPGISWAHHSEDSGDLIAAAWLLGVPHPTGYPLFCILGWIWTHAIPLGSVAWRMNAFSALWAALASGLMVRAVWAALALLPNEAAFRTSRTARAIVAVSSGLLLAFATDVWKQSVVTEVYTLNLFFTALIGWILVELVVGAREAPTAWESRRARLIYALAFAWGLALTNHMTSLFLLPSIVLVPAIAGVRVKAREIGLAVMWCLVPLLLYAYLPIRSSMDPALDYGNPETLDQFIWLVTGKQFRKLMFLPVPYQMLHQVMTHNSIPMELGLLGALASGLGVCRLLLARSHVILALLAHTLILVGTSLFYLANYYIRDPEGYLLPMVWAVCFWAAWAPALLGKLPTGWRKPGVILATVLLVCAPVYAVAAHWSEVDLSADFESMRFGEESFEIFERDAVVIETGYERAFVLWYYREVEYAEERDDVAVILVEHGLFDWGLDLFSRKYPDLVLPETPFSGHEAGARTAAFIIEHNIDRRPMYCSAIVTSLQEKGYRFEAVGLTYRVLPP